MELEKIRQNIDAVDRQMRDLFLERMQLAQQVVETKKKNGAAIFVPVREKEVISSRSKEMDAEYLRYYQAFLRQVMAISRTYQYSQLPDRQDSLSLPKGIGEITFTIKQDAQNRGLVTALEAAGLADLEIKSLLEEKKEGMVFYKLCLQGDFSKIEAKAAALLIAEENGE